MPIFGRLAKRVRDIQVRSLRAKRRRSLLLETLEFRRVLSTTPIIIDNQAACPQYCKVGSWGTDTGLGYANSINYSAAPFTGDDVATWTFNGVQPGLYRVAATWHWGSSIYGSNVPITILSGGTNVIGTGTLNQQLNPNDFQEGGVFWETIGVFNTTTNQLIVRMNDNSSGYAIADAMRIERITAVSDSLIIDTNMPGFSKAGSWGSGSGFAGAYGGNVSWSALPSDGSEVAEWTFNVVPGSYRLSTSLHAGSSIYGSNNPITVFSGSQVVGNLTVDQTASYSDYSLDSAWWKQLGVFTVNSTLKVRMTDLGDGYVITDAFRIQRVADSTPAPLPSSTSIAIVNPSFEAQYVADGAIGQLAITGWGNGLLLNPIAGHFANGAAADGVNVTTGNTSGDYTLSQLLTHTPLPNKEYRLQVDVGDRLDRLMGSWRIELRSNSKALAWMDEKFLSVANGSFSTADFVYTTSDQPLSGPLEIVLISTGTVPNGTVSFDNVRLSMSDSRFASPIANDDLQYYTTTSTDLSAGNSLLANDYSFEGTVSSASIVDHPTHGIIVSFGANGTFVYRPDPGFIGVDSFTYRTHNGVLQSAIARAQISVGTKLLPKLNRDPNVFNATPASAGFGRGYSNIPVASSMDTDGALTKTGGLLLAEDVLPGLSLVYRTDELSRPIIEVESQFPLGVTVPTSIDAQLVFNGVAYTATTFSTTGFVAGDRFRLALQADATSLPTGRYNYQVNLSASGPNWSTSVSGSRVVVNRTASPFGHGWSLDGLDRIHEQADGLMLVAGNGDSLWFPKDGPSYRLADGDTTFTKATKNTDGSYTLTSKDGLVSSFNQMGLLVSHRDRSSNITTFSYADQNGDSSANELVSITEPYGRVVSLWYTSGRVTSLQHYSGRVTQLSYSGSNLAGYTLTDPDGSGPLAPPSISFQYTGNQLTSRTNAVPETTTFEYDANHGRLTKVVHPNFDEWDLVAEETVALPSGSATALKKPADAYGIVTDGEEEVWKFQTDRFGNITKSITPLLNIRTYLRNANGLVYEAREPDPDKAGPGIAPVTRIGYNDTGDASIIVSPDGGITKIKYSDRYRQPVLTVDPVGRTNRNVYDHAGNPVQSIDGAGNMTSQLFNARGLQTQVTTPDPDGTGPQLRTYPKSGLYVN